MSADNGIYILETTDGYRVVERGAIDNIEYHPIKEDGISYMEVFMTWNDKANLTKEEAYLEASKIADELEKHGYPLEYGIAMIRICNKLSWNEIVGRAKDEAIQVKHAMKTNQRLRDWYGKTVNFILG